MALFVVVWLICLLLMLAIDYWIGEAAEFLNAWSVVERLLGREPGAGDSAVYTSLGAFGEAVCVLLATGSVAILMTWLIRRFSA